MGSDPGHFAEMARRSGYEATPQWLTTAVEKAVSLVQFELQSLTIPANIVAGGCLLTPAELRAWAYFSKARAHDQQRNIVQILELEESAPVRQHLLRFKDYWNDPHNANALDE